LSRITANVNNSLTNAHFAETLGNPLKQPIFRLFGRGEFLKKVKKYAPPAYVDVILLQILKQITPNKTRS
jgi:hypothetical protein